ncbi:hypothetical protein B0A54_17035 [Friedmanniomyces endolithicus]|uniref:SPX domain-containing protein n=1 Tax=Friedmanniomyces endolithicus TaxID=329885 RepID=A0A4U0TX88_9PEZI|nr:hypothetical protein B0A54_17035 [Friedmanniomyces endolithicus]
MKFNQEYQRVLANEGFPEQWLESAIDYKHLKKCIKKVHRELHGLGLDAKTISHLSGDPDRDESQAPVQHHDFYSVKEPHLDSIPEEFSPQLRVLVDSRTGTPLDATLTPETKAALKRLARHEIATAEQHAHLGRHAVHEVHTPHHSGFIDEESTSPPMDAADAKWIQLPLATAKEFFDLLAPKLDELEQLREAETRKLEEEILDLGEAVENVVQPVREGFEATRAVSYRDLYFWREMFRLYLEHPVFYASTEQNRGALTFTEAKGRLQAYDRRLRDTGLLGKLKTPQARLAAKQFLDLNFDILQIMHFQEVNARAMTKILKKFDKRTHLEGQQFRKDLVSKYPALQPPTSRNAGGAGGFANSIARDLFAEISSKVLSIVPQIDDWSCPVCYEMAWRPVSLGCCRSIYCIRCIIKLQGDGVTRCPTCNGESIAKADGRNIDSEAMEFLEKYFPLETKKRQKENEKADLERRFGEEFVKPGCTVM